MLATKKVNMRGKQLFNQNDLQQLSERGIDLEDVVSQIEIFKKGIPFVKLLSTCTNGNGLTAIPENELDRLIDIFHEASSAGRIMKFVPASGAASRMFKILHSINNEYKDVDKHIISKAADKGDKDHDTFMQFINAIKKFAFFDDLKNIMGKEDIDIEALISKGTFSSILNYLLTDRGLNYANLPKGLIKFHNYPENEIRKSRTSFEEHLVEASIYAKDKEGKCRIHFTISSEHEDTIKTSISKILPFYESSDVQFEIDYSFQHPSTDTIAVNMDNTPFHDENGRLLFRPGGHGALLRNLNDLNGDIIFIKNIDNVVPDCLKHVTYAYKKALCGFLIEIQNRIFSYLELLVSGHIDDQKIIEIFDFAESQIGVHPGKRILNAETDEKISFLISKLNRPMRVCGMVKNAGEPGGGPFWIEYADKTVSLQIIESSQVEVKSVRQKSIWDSSTHFNPVDLVCGVRDYLGKPFNLMDFSDPDAGFVSVKSKDGKKLKALELPGLWNGSMANWNTVFVEVPAITFNPVKTVFDLLRREHQAVMGN